jgi:steroid delta-isomerase-like uncharacterized protein
MSIETNKDIVNRLWYDELWGQWNTEISNELFAPNYRLHLAGVPQPLDRNGTRHVVEMYQAAFSDMTHTVEELIAEGDTVAARWTVRGTHDGDLQGLEPTGKSVQLTGLTVHHLSGGKIVETWLVFDSAELLQQLGVTAKSLEAGV